MGAGRKTVVGIVVSSFLLCGAAFANELVSEGVDGVVDEHDRAPIVTVTATSQANKTVKISATHTVEHTKYRRYPVQFDFYVNRVLRGTQIWSRQLPGAVGLEVTPEMAATPFNYTVVATLLVPNDRFTTVINGAVFGTTLTATLDCTLTVQTGQDDTQAFVVNNTQTLQPGDNAVGLQFEAQDAESKDTATVEGTLLLKGTALNGSLAIDRSGADKETVAVSGTATLSDGSLTAIDVSSDAETVTLACE